MQTFLFHDDAATAGAATRRPTLLTARPPTAVAPDHCIEYALTLDAAGVHAVPVVSLLHGPPFQRQERGACTRCSRGNESAGDSSKHQSVIGRLLQAGTGRAACSYDGNLVLADKLPLSTLSTAEVGPCCLPVCVFVCVCVHG
jgi:hypothetical protein